MIELLARHASAARNPPGPIQAKLKVGAVNDPLEHEADRVAEQVMRMPAAEVSAAPAQVSRKCAACEGEEKLQRKPAGPQVTVGEAPAIVNEVLRSTGQPLDAATRAYFEPRFGQDFGEVRVHSGARAAQSAQEVGALAYTVGSQVVFGAGQYTSQTVAGRRLLAHELTHVIQQRGSAFPMIARQEASFREKASVIWNVGAISGYRAKKLAAEALEAAQQSGLPGLHNGPADAWRHCYWNCRMAAVIGKHDAAFIAENHEEQAENNPVAERMMDTWNNAEGRNCSGDCDSCCQKKLDAGKLWVLYAGKVGQSKPTPRGGTPSGEKYEKY